MAYVWILFTILLTVYGQMVIKWQVGLAGPGPEAMPDRLLFLMGLLLNPWIASGLVAAFAASIAWMGAVSRMDLSHAYPFMSLNFVLVLFLAAWLFHEPLTLAKAGGVALIVAGVALAARG